MPSVRPVARHLALTGVSAAAAMLAMLMAARAFQVDVQDWNSVCGEAVRTFSDSYFASLDQSGFSGRLPFLAECFLVLIVPSVLMVSLSARRASAVLMLLMMVLSGCAALGVSRSDYYDECFSGGHPNAPGGIVIDVIAAVAFVAFFNCVVLLADWVSSLMTMILDRSKSSS